MTAPTVLSGRRTAVFEEPEEFSGAVLARVLYGLRGDDRTAAISRRVVQDALLAATLQKARASSAFYRERLAHLEIRSGFAALADAPPLTRSEAVANQDRLLAEDVELAFMSHTTGTTTGEYFEVFRSREEQRFIVEFFATWGALDEASAAGGPKPLTLSLPIQHHGTPVGVPVPGHVFIGGVTDDHLIRDTMRLLSSRFSIPRHRDRITIISAPLYCLHFLTSYLHEQGFPFPEHPMDALFTYGQLVTPALRRYLEDAWGTRLVDRYSLTEVFGGATSCVHCGGYHFDDWVVPELADPRGGAAPALDGPGRLLVTGLYPWTQAQPMIRYDTGDVFEPVSCSAHTAGFRFRGRVRNCAFVLEAGRAVLAFSAADAYALLDDLPDIARGQWFVGVTTRDRTPGSLMKLKIDVDSGPPVRVAILAELRYSPHLFPDRAAEVEALALGRLRQHHPNLARLIGAGQIELSVAVVGPGTLAQPHAQKI
ncbi:hypothetical protein [Roseomonas gilardii]|uniref:hypothetical protein n=1 Tax=Roseomonas gilardii TaxID=257708 RepID=UPI0011A13BFF|nr:hypothetical protein [Roseomonas gilardii]